MTYYGRWTYKFEEAARQGAAGDADHPRYLPRRLWLERGQLKLDRRAVLRPECQ